VGHFGGLARSARLERQTQINDIIGRAMQDDADLGAYIDDSVGARRNPNVNMPGEEFRPAHAFGLERAGILSGSMRLLNASARSASRKAEEMTEIGILQSKNFEGTGEAAVTRADNVWVDAREMLHGGQVTWRHGSRDAYRTYAARVGQPTLDAGQEGASIFGSGGLDAISRRVNPLRGRAVPGDFMTERQFFDRAGEYISRRQTGAPIDPARFPPEVRAVAEGPYNEIMQRMAKEGHEVDAFTYQMRERRARLRESLVEARQQKNTARADGIRRALTVLEDDIACRTANPPTGEWHMPHIPNHAAIKASPDEFEALLRAHARVWDDERKAFIRPTRGQIEALVKETLERGVADRLGSHIDASLQKQLKQRRWQIPLHEFPKFYHTNASDLMEIYLRNVSPDFALMRRYGSIAFKPHADEIIAEYTKLIRAKVQANDLIGAGKLAMELTTMLTGLEAIHGMIRGPYGLAKHPAAAYSTALLVAKDLNAATLLSGLTAQIPDLGNIVMRHTLERSFGVAMKAYQRGLTETFGKMHDDIANISKEGLEMLLSSRAGNIAGIGDPVAGATRIERFTQDLADFGFNFALLSNPWNQVAKTFAGMTSSSMMGRALRAVRAGSVDDVARARLRHLGFNTEDKALMDDLVKYLDRYGERDGALELPNLSAWGRDIQAQINEHRIAADLLRNPPQGHNAAHFVADPDGAKALDALADGLEEEFARIDELRTLFGRALGKEIRSAVVTPVPGDSHRYFSTEFGGVILQFKRFATAATQRILISGLQTREASQLNGVALMVALGFAVNAVRDKAFDRPERSFGDSLVSAIDRSGAAGIFSDVNNFIETMTSGEIGARAALGDTGRYTSFGRKAGTVGGPTVAQMLRVAGILSDFGNNDVDRWTGYNIRRMIPYMNATHFMATGALVGSVSRGFEATNQRAEVESSLRERGLLPPQRLE